MSTSAGLTSAFTILMVATDVPGVEPLALLEQRHELIEQPAGPGRLAGSPSIVISLPTHDDVDRKRVFDQPQQLVSLRRAGRP